jgi:hypothetical protein
MSLGYPEIIEAYEKISCISKSSKSCGVLKVPYEFKDWYLLLLLKCFEKDKPFYSF